MNQLSNPAPFLPVQFAPEKVAQTLAVGVRALTLFKTALATGVWPPFFELLSGDFTLYFPYGKFQDWSEGKARGAEFFSALWPKLLVVA